MTQLPPEISHPIALDRIRDTDFIFSFEATADERNAVAGRLQEPLVEFLACSFVLRRPAAGSRGGEIVCEGRLRARVQRECVVSLELFIEVVDQRFRVVFVPEGNESDDADPETDDEIPYSGTMVDLGEAAVEQLALVLDPYPRKPGAKLPEDLNSEPSGPFAALARFARPDPEDEEG